MRYSAEQQRKNDEQLKAKAEEVAQFLKANHLGAGNPTTNHAVAERFELPDIGQAGRAGLENSQLLTKLLLIARQNGHPIVTDRTGIFYAQYAEEIQVGVNHMKSCALKYELHALTLEIAALDLPSRPVAA